MTTRMATATTLVIKQPTFGIKAQNSILGDSQESTRQGLK